MVIQTVQKVQRGHTVSVKEGGVTKTYSGDSDQLTISREPSTTQKVYTVTDPETGNTIEVSEALYKKIKRDQNIADEAKREQMAETIVKRGTSATASPQELRLTETTQKVEVTNDKFGKSYDPVVMFGGAAARAEAKAKEYKFYDPRKKVYKGAAQVTGAAEAISYPITRPKEAVIETATMLYRLTPLSAITQPKETKDFYVGTGRFIYDQPSRFTGQLLGSYALFKPLELGVRKGAAVVERAVTKPRLVSASKGYTETFSEGISGSKVKTSVSTQKYKIGKGEAVVESKAVVKYSPKETPTPELYGTGKGTYRLKVGKKTITGETDIISSVDKYPDTELIRSVTQYESEAVTSGKPVTSTEVAYSEPILEEGGLTRYRTIKGVREKPGTRLKEVRSGVTQEIYKGSETKIKRVSTTKGLELIETDVKVTKATSTEIEFSPKVLDKKRTIVSQKKADVPKLKESRSGGGSRTVLKESIPEPPITEAESVGRLKAKPKIKELYFEQKTKTTPDLKLFTSKAISSKTETKLKTETVTRAVPRQETPSKVILRAKTKTFPIQMVEPGVISSHKIVTKLKPIQEVKPEVIPKTTKTPALISATVNITPKETPTFKPPFRPRYSPGLRPFSGKGKKGITRKQPRAYTPSLVGLFKGTKVKLPKIKKRRLTGLEVRPIPL